MKKIFTLLVCALAFTMAMAQPTATIKKTAVAPVIDGTVDDVWSTTDPIAFEVPFTGENPTVGNSWWKMLWDDQGIYLLCFVDDDKFVPAFKGDTEAHRGETWMYDKLEIYFDCNYEKKDADGPTHAGTGHYQIAPTVKEALLEGGATTESRGEVWAFNASDDPKYYAEYFFPFTMLNDKSGNPVEKTEPIGFDVNIMDNDMADGSESRQRMEWANDGSGGENWANMDNAGLIILEGATPGIDITSLAISGETTITADNGTIQLTAAVTPADATQIYKWKVTNGTGMATISSTGLLTGLRNGTVTVQAVSADEFVSSNELTINISGQKISLDEINMLKNSNFTSGKDNWGGNGVIEENYYNLECTPKANIWDNMFGQQHIPVADATTKYIVKFKAKGTNDMAVPMLFEDRANSNDKVVNSSMSYRDNSYGKWDVPVTTEEKTYEIDVVFSNKKDNSDYELNFQAGMVSGTFSLTNIMMFKESDLALVDPTAGLQTIDESTIKVYPNPVGNATEITVNLVNAKGNVAVYNSLGQRIMEKSATGNTVKFDVSGLQKGLYFVKTSEGATQKFIR